MADPPGRKADEAQAYVARQYRDFTPRGSRMAFRVVCEETDLYIRAQRDLSAEVRQVVLALRGQIEGYIREHPAFRSSLVPLPPDPSSPPVVGDMLMAAGRTGVGPMAAVAGAIAQHVGASLAHASEEVIVENGGDIYLHAREPVTVGIFAGRSVLNMRMGLRIEPAETPCGVCTSSGTVGPSLSLGRADAVTVWADTATLADAAATALANRVSHEEDIEPTLELAGGMPGLRSVLVLLGDRIGVWGPADLVRLDPGARRGVT